MGERWKLRWRRELFVWETNRVLAMMERLEGVVVWEGVDYWFWKPDADGKFTVKSCYLLLQNLWLDDGVLSLEKALAFRELWKSRAPTKVLDFSWILLLDRIPTKVNLDKRRLLGNEDSKRCVFCDTYDESTLHLFLHCEIIDKVWREVMRRLNFNLTAPPNLFIHICCWTRKVWSKKLRRGAWLIWHAVIWVVRLTRNDRIFNNKIIEVEETVDKIKVIAWQWSMCRLKIPTCLFYEWRFLEIVACEVKIAPTYKYIVRPTPI